MIGHALLAVQFALLGWLAWPFTPLGWPPMALALLACSAALGLWTLAHNRPGNFNVRPEPKAAGRLVTSGPYRFARHPMYVTLVLFAAGATAAYADPWKIAATIALGGVLTAKAALEECRLRERYPGYAAYAGRVRRFIPWLY